MILFRKWNIKTKIFYKLIFYFVISLLLFSIVVGGVFSSMFIKNTVNLTKKNLEIRALKISSILSSEPANRIEKMKENFKEQNKNKIHSIRNSSNHINERRRNMRLIEDIAMAEVWYVDAKTGEITQGRFNSNTPSSYLKLPPNAENVIDVALKGKINTSENFSQFLTNRSITIAAPIFDPINKSSITGVVLLHSPISDLSEAQTMGIYTIIFSIIIALILAIISSIILSLSFSKPLNKIKSTALLLSDGDYTAKTKVNQSDEIGELAKTIDELSERLFISSKESERFEKMRNDFITNISHELRTPITVIRGSIEAICDGIITDETMVNEFHQQILSDSIHLQNLVNDLIDLNKLQNFDFPIKKSEINLYDSINDSIRSMRQLANKKNIAINYLSSNSNELLFNGDYQRIRQMIIIILDNAIKFSPNDKNITITSENNENYYNLEISDQGKGISVENTEKIFDRFYKSQNDNNDGMGLGLSIAKQIAIRHNINLSVKSEVDIGTTFSLKFPKN